MATLYLTSEINSILIPVPALFRSFIATLDLLQEDLIGKERGTEIETRTGIEVTETGIEEEGQGHLKEEGIGIGIEVEIIEEGMIGIEVEMTGIEVEMIGGGAEVGVVVEIETGTEIEIEIEVVTEVEMIGMIQLRTGRDILVRNSVTNTIYCSF